MHAVPQARESDLFAGGGYALSESVRFREALECRVLLPARSDVYVHARGGSGWYSLGVMFSADDANGHPLTHQRKIVVMTLCSDVQVITLLLSIIEVSEPVLLPFSSK